MKAKKYDVIVIGAGAGGKITAPAVAMGKKVAVVEKDKLGGTCLNRGCIPSKMLIHPADVADEIREAGKFNINNNPKFSVDFGKLTGRINRIVDGESKGIEAAYNSIRNLDYYSGTAQFVSNRVIEVNGKRITAPKIFIVAGARPFVPPIPGLKGTPYMTSTEALRAKKLPKKLLVFGGGYIGVELGHAYASLGSEVEFVIRDCMMRFEDDEVKEEFERQFLKRYNAHYYWSPTKVEYKNKKFIVEMESPKGAKRTTTADALLVATGVKPNSDLLGLENTSIKVNKRGYIKVDRYSRTTAKGVWAFGDITGEYLFRHSANWAGDHLFYNLFVKKKEKPIDYGPVPHAVFTSPQIGTVGMTEQEVKAKKIPYVVGKNAYKQSAMGMAIKADHGFVKIIVNKKNRKVLGCHIIGPEASNMIHMCIALMYKKATIDDFLNMIYVHPALPEIVRNAARKAKMALDGNTYPK